MGGCSNEKKLEYDVFSAPIVIRFDDVAKSRDNPLKAILDEVNISREMSKAEHDSYGNYHSNKITELEEFYFPVLEIDKFELTGIAIDAAGFGYFYTPINRDNDYHHLDSGIELRIGRPDYVYTTTFEEKVKINNLEIKEDGFAYHEWTEFCAVCGEINGVWFDITANISFADYEYLRDIALQLVKNAKLVDVKQELDVMRKNAD